MGLAAVQLLADVTRPAHYRASLDLLTAAEEGHMAPVRLALAHGARVNVWREWSGLRPLHLAAGEGHDAVVEALIAAGADVNARDEWGRTPLKVAQERGRQVTAELLRKHGATE